jgi:hypothetical protein
MPDRRPTWQLVVEAANKLVTAGQTPFKLEQLVELVQRTDRTRGRSTINPIVQGLTVNAGKGPPQPCGKLLYRVSPGFYELNSGANPIPVPHSSPSPVKTKRIRLLTADELRARVVGLISDFGRCVANYDEQPPFRRPVQYELHRHTIDGRRRLSTVEAAVHDRQFMRDLRDTLAAWGLNQRASHLLEPADFNRSLLKNVGGMAALEQLHLEEIPEAGIEAIAAEVYGLISAMDVVGSAARVVAGTKALHHMLPDLVPPMDRAWTGSFFGWASLDPQNQQRPIFMEAFAVFAEVARATKPSQLVGEKWRTSATKVLDNAVIGYCRLHRLGPTAG